jgi:hypothetical protein
MATSQSSDSTTCSRSCWRGSQRSVSASRTRWSTPSSGCTRANPASIRIPPSAFLPLDSSILLSLYTPCRVTRRLPPHLMQGERSDAQVVVRSKFDIFHPFALTSFLSARHTSSLSTEAKVSDSLHTSRLSSPPRPVVHERRPPDFARNLARTLPLQDLPSSVARAIGVGSVAVGCGGLGEPVEDVGGVGEAGGSLTTENAGGWMTAASRKQSSCARTGDITNSIMCCSLDYARGSGTGRDLALHLS